MSQAKSYAIYLPQFHPIAENNEWWGEGFTEWNNVVRGAPAFDGHYQPHLPADLGFYDLRLPEVREAQARLAAEHNINGFIYYHYWFNGSRLLERPFNEVLESGKPDLPFALCWANEDWRRNWDGSSGELLRAQNYSEEDDRRHIAWLIEAFKDDRYIRIDEKPLFAVYRSHLFPDMARTTSIWREEAERAGIGELYLVRMESFDEEHDDPTHYGFDASVEFSPDWSLLQQPAAELMPRLVHDYDTYTNAMLAKEQPTWRRFPCVTPQWDNSARRPNDGLILRDSTPEKYEGWVLKTLEREKTRGIEDPILFVNAWNEWGEGCHLEPDQKWGRGYLEAHSSAIQIFEGKKQKTAIEPEVVEPDGEITETTKTSLSTVLLATATAQPIQYALQSVHQTCGAADVEMIIVENCHVDDNLASNDIKVIKNASPVSVSSAWSQGMEEASGEYILLMSADIILQNGWLEQAFATLERDPRCGAVSATLKKGNKSLPSQPPASGSGVCILARTSYLESGAPLSVKQAHKAVVRWQTQPIKARV